MKSPVTTLCYIEQDDKYLMLHRIKKKNDLNEDKWVGIGGHAEEGESPGRLPSEGGYGGNRPEPYLLSIPRVGDFCIR